jgi:hypothetical protein
VENENRLSASISAGRWLRLESVGAQEKLFNCGGRIDVEGTGDVPTIVLVIKPTVNDVIRGELAIIHSVQEVI